MSLDCVIYCAFYSILFRGAVFSRTRCRPVVLGSAESEHPRLTNREIIFEEVQPMWSQSTNVADRRTDRQTTCDRKTALCTKVHRAVIIRKQIVSLVETPNQTAKLHNGTGGVCLPTRVVLSQGNRAMLRVFAHTPSDSFIVIYIHC